MSKMNSCTSKSGKAVSEYGASLAAAAAAWPSFTMAAAAPKLPPRPAPPRPLSRDNTIQLQHSSATHRGQLGQLNPDKAAQKYLAAHRMGPKHQPRHFRCSFHNFTLTSRLTPASFSNRPYTGQCYGETYQMILTQRRKVLMMERSLPVWRDYPNSFT